MTTSEYEHERARYRLLYPRYRSDIIVRSRHADARRVCRACRQVRVLQRTARDRLRIDDDDVLGLVFNNLLLLLSIVVASAYYDGVSIKRDVRLSRRMFGGR